MKTVVGHPGHAADVAWPTWHEEGVGLWGVAVATRGIPSEKLQRDQWIGKITTPSGVEAKPLLDRLVRKRALR